MSERVLKPLGVEEEAFEIPSNTIILDLESLEALADMARMDAEDES